MISLHCSTENRYTLYGIHHFIQKYGIPVQINDDKNSKISIVYGNETCKGDFIIKICEEEINDDEFALRILQNLDPEEGLNDIYKLYILHSENQIDVKFDIFKEIGYFLSGKFEEALSKLDYQQRKKIARMPIVDIYEKMLFDQLLYACQKSDMPLVQKAFWPDEKNFAVCLTHDVDELRKTYQYFTRSVRHLKRGEFGRAWYHINSFFTDKLFGRNPYWAFNDIMKIENELNVRSTFFFLNETAKVNIFRPATWTHYARRYDLQNPKITELIKELASRGWEVGLHGSFYSYNGQEKMKSEKDLLEEVLGAKVHGIRQHNLNLDITNTWKHQEKIGLEYDTTLGFNDYVGFRWETSFPFHPFDKEAGEPLLLLEIPLVIEDIALFSYDDPWKACVDIINRVEKYGGVLTLLWHHSVFNVLEYPGWSEMYHKLINLCKEKDAWITNAYEITKWWRSRKDVQ